MAAAAPEIRTGVLGEWEGVVGDLSYGTAGAPDWREGDLEEAAKIAAFDKSGNLTACAPPTPTTSEGRRTCRRRQCAT